MFACHLILFRFYSNTNNFIPHDSHPTPIRLAPAAAAVDWAPSASQPHVDSKKLISCIGLIIVNQIFRPMV